MANENKMNIIEALVKLRNDLKLWVANNLRVLNDKKLDKDMAAELYPSKTEINNSIATKSLTVNGKTINEIIVETVGDSEETFNTHVDDKVIHITEADRITWNSKVDATAVQTQINNVLNNGNFVTQTELNAHTLADVHVTAAEKESWNSKAEAEHTHAIADINGLQEALNNGGGGSGVQSDLAVNDATDPAYVKNRTHWIETEQLADVEILPTVSMPIGYYSYTTSPFVLEEGKKYKVVFDGYITENVECYAENGMLCLGDSEVPTVRDNSTSGGGVTPLGLYLYYVEYNPSTQYLKLYATDKTAHTIQIFTYGTVVESYKTLDDRFLSDGVVKPIIVDMVASNGASEYSYSLSEDISTLIANGKKVVLHYNGKLYEYAGTRNKDVADYMFMRISYASGMLEFETVEATGTYADMYIISSGGTTELPAVTTADNGKFLRVVNGVWTAQALDDVSEVGA